MIFKDRREAGRLVADKLLHYKDREGVIVLALPRGGVMNGFEIAGRLGCPLDVIIVRKIGFPGQPELAAGAVSETGAVVLNRAVIEMGGVSDEYIKEETNRQLKEIMRRIDLYRGGKGHPPFGGKTIILVDDGVATGATMKAAIEALKEEKPERLIAALPVSSVEAGEAISGMVDEWVCLHTPPEFAAIGNFYEDFRQVSDDEVVELLKRRRDGR
jgi:putative phosphoribosyl transferase